MSARRLPPWLVEAAACALVATLAFVAMAADTSILSADWSVPTCFLGGDGLYFAAMHFKGTLDTGWYLHNPFVGAPWGADLRDFPAPDLIYLGLIKALVVVTRSWALTFNLVAIGGYPLAAGASFLVLRRYGVRFFAAAVASILFALLPYHQNRVYGHIHLGFSYFAIPFASLPALEILRGAEVLVTSRPSSWRPQWRGDRRSLGLLAISAITGVWGFVYYSFFAMAMTLLAGVARGGRERHLLPLLRAAAFTGVTAVTFVLSNASTLLYLHANGRVPQGERPPYDAEVFGLKVVQLLMPIDNHRFGPFRRLRWFYDHTAPLVTENGSSNLGLVGAAGFLFLLFVVLRGPREDDSGDPRRAMLWPLSILSLGTVLVATIGGFGSLIAYLVFPEVRSYNRISAYTGFYALFAVAILFDGAQASVERWAVQRRRLVTGAFGALAALLTVLGVFDQTWVDAPDYGAAARAFQEDEDFVAAVERGLPPGAQVFQLPYWSFPEGGPHARLDDYAPFVGYVHSKKLRFSYGVMRGRLGDEREMELAETPPQELAAALVVAGYQAVWLDPRAYGDGAPRIAAALKERLGEPLAVSHSGIRVWSLVQYAQELEVQWGQELRDRAVELRDRPFVAMNDGFWFTPHGNPLHLARQKAKVFITNPTGATQRWAFTAGVQTATSEGEGSHLWVDGLFSGTYAIGPKATSIEQTVDVPPGTHELAMRTDAPVAIDRDSRQRAFVLVDPKFRRP